MEIDDKEEIDKKEGIEIEESDTEKKKGIKILAAITGVFMVVVVLFILSFFRVSSIAVNHAGLDFDVKDTQKAFIILNIPRNKGFFKVYNFWNKILDYEIKAGNESPWISFDPTTGSIYKEEDTITVNINRAKMSIGENKGVIKVKSNGEEITIEVSAIRGKDKLTLISPSPGSLSKIGEDLLIRWKATLGVFDFVNIDLLWNGCVVENIANYHQYRYDNKSPGEFKWDLKEKLLPGGEGYTIRVEDARNKNIFDEVFPVKIGYNITKIQYSNISTAHQTPSTVQYIFSLRDQFNHAVIMKPGEINRNTLKIWENEEEIDYLESRTFLSTQRDFQLHVMLVLDFSASMNANMNGIETMIEGANSLIDSLKETHQIGVIEFHGPQTNPLILQSFVTNKKAAKDAIANFASKSIYNDFSICWDAVYSGLEQYPTIPDPKVFRALVFLSDGFDNSSANKPKNIFSLAKRRNVHIYNIGVGEVHEEEVLKRISNTTGGTYVHAKNICVLLERFQQIIRDLGGQYKLSYITPKKPKDGLFAFKNEITYKGVTSAPPLTGKIEASSIYGDTLRGILSFSTFSDKKNKTTEILVSCEHTPRYVRELRFNLGNIKPDSVSLIPANKGGLCENWKVTYEKSGWYKLISPDATNSKFDLEFGKIGAICKIVLKGTKESSTSTPFNLDNSVYSLGQSFYGGNNSEIDEDGNWNTNIKFAPSNEVSP